jgi:hypothetical protein
MHHDIQHIAERVVAHTHLNPAARYPRIFIELAGNLTDRRLLLVAGGAALYSLVRFVEAYGLCAREPGRNGSPPRAGRSMCRSSSPSSTIASPGSRSVR